jgi:triacylglycerol lipase
MDWKALKKVNGFSKPVAHILAHASSDAYMGDREKAMLEDKWGCDITNYSVNGTELTAFDGDSLIIAFRGTEPDKIEDVKADFLVTKSPLSDRLDDASLHVDLMRNYAWEKSRKCFVHSGFLRAYRQVSSVVEGLARKAKRDVFLCGHSLGGSIANVAALDLSMRGVDFRRSYTFGSPRVFGWRAAQEARNLLNGRMFRVVNRNDIVPRVPSCVRFQHVGTLAYINRFNDIQIPVAGYVTYDRIIGYRANMLRSHFIEHYKKGTTP